MAQVFISHSAHDIGNVQVIRDRLEKAGFSVWMDSILSPDDDWQASIETALHDADKGLLLLSRAALNSPSVAHEYTYFIKMNKPLYIAQIESVREAEIPYLLKSFRWLDLVEDFEEGMNSLISALHEQSELPMFDVAAEAGSEKRGTKVTLKLRQSAQGFNPDDWAALIDKLAKAGFEDIEVENVDGE